MVSDLNGEWPDLAVSIDLPPPKAHYTDRELAQTYATLAIHHGILWPKVVSCLEYLRGYLVGAKGEAANASKTANEAVKVSNETAKEVKLLREALQGQAAANALGLPTVMRQETPSTVSTVESVTTKISGEFQKIARESIGPKVEAEPQRLLQVVEKTLTEELSRRDAAKLAVENAAKLKAFEDASKERKKLLKKAAGAFLLAVATAGGTWAWGRAAGHLEGKVEGRQTALEELRKAPATAAATAAALAEPAPAIAPKR